MLWQGSLFQAYCLTRMDQTHLLTQRQAILTSMLVRAISACSWHAICLLSATRACRRRLPWQLQASAVKLLMPGGLQETAANDMASQGSELAPHLGAHMSGQQQLDANTTSLTLLSLSFQLGTWGLVVNPIQMADLAQLGGQRVLPSMWCVPARFEKDRLQACIALQGLC